MIKLINHINSNLPGFQVPVEVCVDEKEGREQEHVDKVGGDAVGVVQHHPDHPHNRLCPAEAQDVPVQPEMGKKIMSSILHPKILSRTWSTFSTAQ